MAMKDVRIHRDVKEKRRHAGAHSKSGQNGTIVLFCFNSLALLGKASTRSERRILSRNSAGGPMVADGLAAACFVQFSAANLR